MPEKNAPDDALRIDDSHGSLSSGFDISKLSFAITCHETGERTYSRLMMKLQQQALSWSES
jgi:hypothetical protein